MSYTKVTSNPNLDHVDDWCRNQRHPKVFYLVLLLYNTTINRSLLPGRITIKPHAFKKKKQYIFHNDSVKGANKKSSRAQLNLCVFYQWRRKMVNIDRLYLEVIDCILQNMPARGLWAENRAPSIRIQLQFKDQGQVYRCWRLFPPRSDTPEV